MLLFLIQGFPLVEAEPAPGTDTYLVIWNPDVNFNLKPSEHYNATFDCYAQITSKEPQTADVRVELFAQLDEPWPVTIVPPQLNISRNDSERNGFQVIVSLPSSTNVSFNESILIGARFYESPYKAGQSPFDVKMANATIHLVQYCHFEIYCPISYFDVGSDETVHALIWINNTGDGRDTAVLAQWYLHPDFVEDYGFKMTVSWEQAILDRFENRSIWVNITTTSEFFMDRTFSAILRFESGTAWNDGGDFTTSFQFRYNTRSAFSAIEDHDDDGTVSLLIMFCSSLLLSGVVVVVVLVAWRRSTRRKRD